MKDYRKKFALTIAECVETGPFGKTSLYEEIGQGRLRVKKNGRRTYVMLEDWLAFLKQEPDLISSGELTPNGPPDKALHEFRQRQFRGECPHLQERSDRVFKGGNQDGEESQNVGGCADHPQAHKQGDTRELQTRCAATMCSQKASKGRRDEV